jgi:2-polyprenyl-3-methyl-5-hydroxy-6-metoxy-1,4-benzoquinol methylase
MEHNPLKIVSVETTQPEARRVLNRRNAQREEMQARMDHLWHQNPEQFNPLRNCSERERLERTLHLIREYSHLSDQFAVDLGCASGVFSKKLRDAGASVHAVDVSSLALNKLRESEAHHIEAIQDCLPDTSLKDNTYDLVVCTDVIGFLNPQDYRLLFSELSRLVKSEGFVVCSTALDINTEDPLDKFAKLAETEFNISKWKMSYHLLHIRLSDFFEAPARFVRASREPDYRHREVEKRKGFSRLWFQWNSAYAPSFLWYPLYILATPIVSLLQQSRYLMIVLEKITHFLWNESGISHAIFIGQRRPLVYPLPREEKPRELKHKKQVWE